MAIERRFSNLFPNGEDAHAFETAVRGAAIAAGLSVGPGDVVDRGLPGHDVITILAGEPDAVDRFAAERHAGTMLGPLRVESQG